MEKQIKALYSLTIVAILAFIGMQVYWLYSRYEFSLRQYEDYANTTVRDLLKDYRGLRSTGHPDTTQPPLTSRSVYNLNTDTDSLGKIRLHATVTTLTYSVHKLLGLTNFSHLTRENYEEVDKIISESLPGVKKIEKRFDASNAPSDGAVWSAMKNVDLEIESPFTEPGIDSMLRKSGIEAEISLITTDTMIWQPTLQRHSTLINPKVRISSPYSELERKSVVIEWTIPMTEVMKEMGWSLIMAVALSILLILCLMWQFSTILKLTRLDKMRNMFVTTMIHELKRPISTLKMCVSGIENEQMLADKEIKAELTSATRTALDNLSAYFSKLRDITFNDVEQIPLNVTKFNMSKLIDDVMAAVAVPGFKSVSFHNNLGSGMEISADPTHLFNIINNLIENAIKYSGNNVEITVEATADDDSVSLKVSDTGNGIPESDLTRIFTRFYRGRASATDIPGMGLGLTYVKLLTEAHGGKVSVNSRPGKGTSFTITLPQ